MPRKTELSDTFDTSEAKPIHTDRIKVVAGILRDNNKILIADRSRSRSMQDYWEFPGGKVESDETEECALRRELEEELGIRALRYTHFRRLEHDYPDLSVRIDFYDVNGWEGIPDGREGQQLKWVNKNELGCMRLLPADAPIVRAVCRQLELESEQKESE